ncbi:MAG: cardiolipin synthase [Synergistaceae bacterium]|nr:cardiolipin synthase [Synergistaceae bacterium]
MQNTSPEITANSNVRLLLDGHETFSAIKEALRNAKHFINLEYFLISDDNTGNAIRNILAERSRAGVRVRVIFDAAGSWALGRRFVDELRNAGAEIRRFMPLTLRNMFSGIIHRDHRKLITIDGKTGLLGGFNIGDVYLTQWRDTHLMLEGEAVNVLDGVFAEMWDRSGGKGFARESSARERFGVSGEEKAGSIPVKVLASGTGKDFRAIADEYIRIISESLNRVWITTPYLVPDRAFLEAVYSAARRGVDVRIIIPSESNHMLASWASQSYIDELIRNRVRVFVYRERFIHAKTLVADSQVASVGTANIDALSFGINYEVQAFVYSQSVVNELEGVFLADLQHCTEETPENRNARPFLQRLKEKTGRLLSPIL